jgi:hypothetical protein
MSQCNMIIKKQIKKESLNLHIWRDPANTKLVETDHKANL